MKYRGAAQSVDLGMERNEFHVRSHSIGRTAEMLEHINSLIPAGDRFRLLTRDGNTLKFVSSSGKRWSIMCSPALVKPMEAAVRAVGGLVPSEGQ